MSVDISFALTAKTSPWSAADQAIACAMLDKVEAVLGKGAPVAQAAAAWSPAKRFHFEFDDAPCNYLTSFELLRTRDPDILRKLRLYAQTFSGYQLAFLRHAKKEIPWLRSKLPDNYDEFLRLFTFAPDLYPRMFVHLVNSLPRSLRLSLPWRFGEIGWIYDNMIANHDAFMYLVRVAHMHEFGVLAKLESYESFIHKESPVALEIGGGFGGLAYMLKRACPRTRYVIVDLPESLAFSSIYLGVLFPNEHNEFLTEDKEHLLPDKPGFTFVPSAFLENLRFRNGVDVAINTISFGEMTAEQVRRYCKFIAWCLKPGGVFYEQNNEYSDESSETLDETITPFFLTTDRPVPKDDVRNIIGVRLRRGRK